MSEFVFLVCSERSGSNFITSLMNGHEAICGPPPSHLFRLFGTNMERYGDLQQDDNWEQLLADFSQAFAAILGVWNSSADKEELASAVSRRTGAALLQYIYEKEASLDKATHVFVKENRTYSFAPFLMGHLPESRFLLSVRDPRDVALSWKTTKTIPGGVKEAVDNWTTDQSGALSLYGQLSGTDRCKLVRYEDILSNTVATVTEILRWMGLEFSDDILQFHRDDRTRLNAARIAAWDNLAAGILRDNHAKYLDGLSHSEILYVELRCQALMSVFGYQPSEPAIPMDDAEREEKIRQLEASLDNCDYVLDPSEEAIRQKRLRAIQNVLNRSQQCQIAPTR